MRAVDYRWRALVADELTALGMDSKADRFLDCGNVTSVIACSSDHDHYAVQHTNTCQLVFCPDCARRLAAEVCGKYTNRVRTILKENKNSGYRLRRITLTRSLSLRDEDIVHQMSEAWIDLSCLFDVLCGNGEDSWSHASSKDCTGEGYFASAEFGERGHKLHFHIAFFGRWVEQRRLSDLWAYFNPAGDYIVDIRAENTQKAVKETLKYVAKFTKSFAVADGDQVKLLPDPKFLARLAYVFHGTRRIRSRGCFYGIEDEVEENGVIEELCPKCGSPLVALLPGYWQSLHSGSDLDLLYLKRVDKFLVGHGAQDRAPPVEVQNA